MHMIIVFLSVWIPVAFSYERICYGSLGCFTTEPPWGNTEQRPIDLLPRDPNSIDTRLFLDTKGQQGVEIFNDDLTSAKDFNPNKMTRVIIPGYDVDEDISWTIDLSNSLLRRADENVIRVVWSSDGFRKDYDQLSVDMQVVGSEVALLVNGLANSAAASPSLFHCIGHSIGAHACAYVSNKAPFFGRISGLDPTGPLFSGTPIAVRLDESDANFVDVIHTDADKYKDEGIGIPQQSGDVDFWPNDGIEQPGCEGITTILDPIFGGKRDYSSCNHYRAVSLYLDSITSSCPFMSYPCLNYQDFLAGKCLTCDGTGCPKMGFYADSSADLVSKTQTYLQTREESPFCEYLTDIVVQTGQNTKTIKGEIYIALNGPHGSTEQQQLGGDGNSYSLTSGAYYSSLTYYGENPGRIDNITLRWVQDEIELGHQYITVHEVAVWAGLAQQEFYFCGDELVYMDEKTDYVIPPC